MKTKLLLIGLVLLFISCGKGYWFYSKHFVSAYFDTETIELEHSGNYLYANGKKIVDIFTVSYIDTSIHEFDEGRCVGREEYLALCEKHGDMNYNQKVSMDTRMTIINLDFVSVSIVSDSDYDAEHPAGSELGDIVMFESITYIDYIRSGYQGQKGKMIYKLVSELLPDDMILLHMSMPGSKWLARLKFFSDPTLSKVHNITVTMVADNGKVVSDTVKVSWE